MLSGIVRCRVTGRSLLLVLLMLLILLLPSGVALADPGHAQPQAALDVHGPQDARQLHAQCVARVEKIEQTAPEYLQALSDGKLSAGRMKEAGLINVALNQLIREGQQLQWMGEPSGVDFERRGGGYKARWDDVIRGYRSLDTARRTIEGIRAKARQEEKKRQKQIESLQRLAQEQQWKQAETQLYDALDELQSMICFLEPNEQNAILEPYGPVRAVIERTAEVLRRQDGANSLDARRRQLLPAYDTILADVQRALTELSAGGSAQWNGQSLTAVPLLQPLLEQWKQVHVATLQARAVEWARGDLVPADPAPLQAIYAAYDQFSAGMAGNIGRVIEVESQRAMASGDEQQQRQAYDACLKAVAQVLARTDYRPLHNAARQALDKFAGQSFALKQDVQSHEQATGELLRWRRRVAEARATKLAQQFPDLRDQFPQAARSTTQLRGLFVDNSNRRYAYLVGTAPEAVKLVSANLGGRAVALGPVYHLGGAAQTGIAAFERRTYGSFSLTPLHAALTATVPTMQRELLVDADHPALSLDSAVALSSAEMGDVRRLGGSVQGLVLEALVTRQATLPPAAWVLEPLGMLSELDYARTRDPQAPAEPAVDQMQMRFDLLPQWGHNGYALVLLPAAG